MINTTVGKDAITYRDGRIVYLDELREDIKAAKEKGLFGKWAFTPETVEALLDDIERRESGKADNRVYSCLECRHRNDDNTCDLVWMNHNASLIDDLLRIPIWCPDHSSDIVYVKGISDTNLTKFCEHVSARYKCRVGWTYDGERRYYRIGCIGIINTFIIEDAFYDYFKEYLYTIIRP